MGGFNWSAKVGGVIRGGLKRGSGGKFSSGGSAKGGTAPKKSPFEGIDVPESALNALGDLATGAKPDAEGLAQLQAMGFADADGKLTRNGKSLASAIKAKDWEKARGLLTKGLAKAQPKAPKGSKGKAKKTPQAPANADALAKSYKVDSAVVKALKSGKLSDLTDKQKQQLIDQGLYDASGNPTRKGKKLLAALKGLKESQPTRRLSMGRFLEAMTKKIGNRTHVASDFLVVEDPESPSTWHMPVMVSGKPDRRLMGAAWAALFDPKGYQGNPYAGPKKSQAQSKLKALYKKIGAEMPASEAEIEPDYLWVGSDYLSEGDFSESLNLPYYAPYGAKSFEDLIKSQQAREAGAQVEQLAMLFPQLINNILNDPMEEDKVGAIEDLTTEFVDLVGQALGDMESYAEEDGSDDEPNLDETLIVKPAEFAELAEDSTDTVEVEGEKRKTLAYVTIQAIKPGWGNKRDNNFYPAELLASQDTRDLFIKRKMYETDHDDNNRSTANWVSTIIEDKGLSGDGAPTFKVAIHDPGFAERMRNLKALGLLDMMECSIQGAGQGIANFELEGRRGQRITKFDDIKHVDWVTRAGAGGHALEMEEADNGGSPMEDQNKKPAEVAEKDKPVPTAIKEHEAPAAPETPAPDATPAAPAPEPASLEPKAVKDELAKSTLPEASQERLAGGKYANLSELQKAIETEIAYVKQLTGSGKPFGMGETAPANSGSPAAALKELADAKDAVNEKFMG